MEMGLSLSLALAISVNGHYLLWAVAGCDPPRNAGPCSSVWLLLEDKMPE